MKKKRIYNKNILKIDNGNISENDYDPNNTMEKSFNKSKYNKTREKVKNLGLTLREKNINNDNSEEKEESQIEEESDFQKKKLKCQGKITE